MMLYRGEEVEVEGYGGAGLVFRFRFLIFLFVDGVSKRLDFFRGFFFVWLFKVGFFGY